MCRTCGATSKSRRSTTSRSRSQVRRHVAPHATEVAAMFSVLTRMRKAEHREVRAHPVDRGVDADGGGEDGAVRDGARARAARSGRAEGRCKSNIGDSLHAESDAYPIYEGRIGASPREMRIVLLDAAQSLMYKCLSPLAVLDEIEQLSTRKERVRVAPARRGHRRLPRREARSASCCSARLLTAWEEEFYTSRVVSSTRGATPSCSKSTCSTSACGPSVSAFATR